MSADPIVLNDIPLAIDPEEVLRFQGYKRDGAAPGPDVRALFDEALAVGRTLIAPRAVLVWNDVVGQTGDSLRVRPARAAGDGGCVTLAIPGIARHWGRIERACAVVCTIGDTLERRVAELWDARELPLAAMLDSVGSGAVESLAEYVNDHLCQQDVTAGVRVTNRISPGYAAWDVAEQPLLFRLSHADAIGVTLNEACFMLPAKSISLLVGAGPQARVDHYFSQCARCWMAGCAYRRAGMKMGGSGS
jgi:hypothetical protein